FHSQAEDVPVQDVTDVVPQAWQMLDYLATDYAGAVSNGEVVDDFEYAEMQEFSNTIGRYIAILPEHEVKADLVEQAQALQLLVENKASNTEVNKKEHTSELQSRENLVCRPL